MGTVKLAAALPKEPELNGLMDHAVQLLREPGAEYLIVARVSVKQIIDDKWEGTRVPVIGVVAAELATEDDEDLARQLMNRAKDRRYARRPLPWKQPGTLGSAE
jgi:hypothetical protein